MDKFVSITKPGGGPTTVNGHGKPKNPYKYNPYPIPQAKQRQVDAWRDKKRTEKILAPLRAREQEKTPSSKALTTHLLNTLKDPSNPITHSTIGQLSDHVDSCVTGHQRSDGPGRPTAYLKSRHKKLEEQRLEKGKDANGALRGVRIYVGGYMSGTTDIEIKRIVTRAGGKIMHTAAGATHVLTSQGLSGSKAHKHLHANPKKKAHVVKPEWVLDSIAAGTKKKEWDYTVVKDSTAYELRELGIVSSASKST